MTWLFAVVAKSFWWGTDFSIVTNVATLVACSTCDGRHIGINLTMGVSKQLSGMIWALRLVANMSFSCSESFVVRSMPQIHPNTHECDQRCAFMFERNHDRCESDQESKSSKHEMDTNSPQATLTQCQTDSLQPSHDNSSKASQCAPRSEGNVNRYCSFSRDYFSLGVTDAATQRNIWPTKSLQPVTTAEKTWACVESTRDCKLSSCEWCFFWNHHSCRSGTPESELNERRSTCTASRAHVSWRNQDE